MTPALYLNITESQVIFFLLWIVLLLLYLKIRTGDVAQVVECLLGNMKPEFKPSPTKKQKKKKIKTNSQDFLDLPRFSCMLSSRSFAA
jgi:hypothetical protein